MDTAIIFLTVFLFVALALFLWKRRNLSMGGSSPVTDNGPSVEAKKVPNPATVSVFAPEKLEKAIPFLLNVWLYRESQREEVAEAGGKVTPQQMVGDQLIPNLDEGEATIEFRFKPTYLHTALNRRIRRKPCVTESRVWTGNAPIHVAFPVLCPRTVSVSRIHETIQIFANGIFLGACYLELDFNQGEVFKSRFEAARSAFASYSSKDRKEVLARLQIFDKLLGMDIFLDVDSIRVGEDWESRLSQEILSRDKFLLFWSDNAAESKWVEREWRLALEKRGIHVIEPVPLQHTRPPRPLRSLQFRDRFTTLHEFAAREGSPAGD